MFARAAGGPADRNLIDLYADAGIEFIGLRDDRPTTSSGLLRGMLTFQGRRRPSMPTTACWWIPIGRCEASKDY